MKKVKKFLFVILIVLIINLFFIVNVSNASIFGNDLTSGTTDFNERGSEQLENMGVGENILDGLWDYVGDIFLIVMGVALVTTIIVAIMVNFKNIGSDGGKVYTPEERKQVQRQLLLLIALFGGMSFIILIINSFF